MDPQSFVRLSIGALALRWPSDSPPESSPEYSCHVRLRGQPPQTAAVPPPEAVSAAAVFYLSEAELRALAAPPACLRASRARLQISVYCQRRGKKKKNKVGVWSMSVGAGWLEPWPGTVHSGWVGLGRGRGAELHLTVSLDPDPRFVLRFEGEPAASPQVVLLRGAANSEQPIFSCRFSPDRRPAAAERRKGWRAVIHDLSGAAVASAAMATPFVPATGTDRVARTNPGAWAILRVDPGGPAESWVPWGRLEAWRESGARVGCRLLLLEDGSGGVPITEARIGARGGGEFAIDTDRLGPAGGGGGFVMSCRVRAGGGPLVQLAVRHVACVEDAAVFVALAAAVDLSVLACRPFSGRRKTTTSPSPSP
ncbi:nuclear factor 1 A-type protein (DUF1005) [Wolffia australiana]